MIISPLFLRSIHQKAGRLEERFGIELSKGNIPQDLSLQQIISWNSHLASAGSKALSKRKSWFAENREPLIQTADKYRIENEDLTGWIISFKKVLTAFYDHKENSSPPPFIKKNKPVPFEELLIPWVVYATTHIFENHPLLSTQAQKGLARDLLKTLSRLSAACSLEAFNAFQQKSGVASEGQYQRFIADMYAGGAFEFWETYAALARMLVEVMEQWIQGTSLLMERFEKDYSAISTHFFGIDKIGAVAKVQSNLSSQHTGDGQVHILLFWGNKRIVYKPRSAGQDKALEQILNWVNTKGTPFDLQAASTLDCDTHAWQAYIPYSSCTKEEEVEAFYRRQGQLAGLLYTLGSTDYHFGNVMARSAFPVLIDNETLFSPILQGIGNTSISGDSFLDDKVKDSLAHSHFLMDTARLFFPNAPSIIGVFEQEEHYPIDQFLPINQDSMALHKAKMIRKGQNIAKLNGQITDPHTYIPSLKKGFTEMMELIRGNVEMFYEQVKKASHNFQLEIRLLVRSTFYYHKVLTQSLAPDLCKNGIDRSIYFEQIAPFYLNSASTFEAKRFLNAEKLFLQSHLIPWFHVRMDQNHLGNDPAESAQKSIFKKSAKALFEHRLALSQNQAVAESHNKLFDHYYSENPNKRKKNWDKEEVISNLFFCYTHFYSPPPIQPNNKSFNYYFLEKGILGVILLFAAWFRVKGNPLYKSLCMRLLQPLLQDMDFNSDLPFHKGIAIGAINGLGSMVNTLCLTGLYLDEKAPIDLAEQIFKAAMLIKTKDHSFGTGLAGLLYAGLQVRKLRPSTAYDAFLSKRLGQMIKKATSKSNKDLGFTKGLTGVLFSTYLLAAHLEEHDCKKAIEKLSNKLRKRIRKAWEPGSLSFQSGLAGWVIADIACQKMGLDSILPMSQEEAAMHLSQWELETPDYYSLGIAGRLEALMLLEPDPFQNLATWQKSWKEKIQAHRKYQLSPTYLNPFFYDGIAGILYQQVRLDHPKILLSMWEPLS